MITSAVAHLSWQVKGANCLLVDVAKTHVNMDVAFRPEGLTTHARATLLTPEVIAILFLLTIVILILAFTVNVRLTTMGRPVSAILGLMVSGVIRGSIIVKMLIVQTGSV
jgi:hypothetical protein